MNIREYFTQHPGSQLALARLLNVTPGFISHLATGRRPVPIKYCLQIEQYTQGKVTRRDLTILYRFGRSWPKLFEFFNCAARYFPASGFSTCLPCLGGGQAFFMPEFCKKAV